MSNQEPQNQEKTAEEPALEKRRRFIKGAGIAAPVVLSLANRTALGAQCLSQQISGNMSHHGAGDCVLGYSPSVWQPTTSTPAPRITAGTPTPTSIPPVSATNVRINGSNNKYDLSIIYTSTSQITYNWTGTTYVYGILTTATTAISLTQQGNGNPPPSPTFTISEIGSGDITPTLVGKTLTNGTANQYIQDTSGFPIRTVASPTLHTDFTQGTTYNTAFGHAAYDPTLSNTSMREILASHPGTPDAYCVAALLNASSIPGYAGGTPSEVIAMCNGTDPVPPGYASLAAFFASTW